MCNGFSQHIASRLTLQRYIHFLMSCRVSPLGLQCVLCHCRILTFCINPRYADLTLIQCNPTLELKRDMLRSYLHMSRVPRR
jgi:hypothetical protein